MTIRSGVHFVGALGLWAVIAGPVWAAEYVLKDAGDVDFGAAPAPLKDAGDVNFGPAPLKKAGDVEFGPAPTLGTPPRDVEFGARPAKPKDAEVVFAPAPKRETQVVRPAGGDQRAIKAAIDDLRLETGVFSDDPGADTFNLVHGAASIKGPLSADWEFSLGARLDGHFQTGTRSETQRELDYGENFLRWRGGNSSLTLGTQNILWGRVDEIPPADRLSRVDLSRFILDELPDRRRAVPALRLEHFAADYKIDAAWVPVFDPAVMPDPNSVWHPFDRSRGRLLGVKPSDMPGAVISNSILREDDDGSGGAGVRITRTGGDWDYGFSLQHSRQSAPYYRLDALVPTPTFTAVHPYSWVLGGELETQRAGATWRLEAAWSSDVPVTSTTLQYRTEQAMDLVLGSEFFPGDSETRVTLQLAAHKTFADGPVIDRTRIVSFNGELEHPFAHGRWRANLRFFAGLDKRDVYLNPKLSYLGFEPHELYISAHLFSGEAQTLGGFHENNDLISLGWQAKF